MLVPNFGEGASCVTADGLGQIEAKTEGPLRLRDALLVLASPGRVFARIEDTGAYGWALVTFLILVFLIGYSKVQTGLIDQDIDRQTERSLAELEKTQGHLLDRVELADRMESIRKAAVFNKTIARLLEVIWAPIYFLASFLLIASLLYAVVALTGAKPEYHTLMSICVYAGFIELVAFGLVLAMLVAFQTTRVNTSLAMLAEPGSPTVLSAIDPFRVWFWVLVAMGLTVTRQLTRRMAILACSLFCAIALGVRMGLAYVAG